MSYKPLSNEEIARILKDMHLNLRGWNHRALVQAERGNRLADEVSTFIRRLSNIERHILGEVTLENINRIEEALAAYRGEGK